MIERYAREEMKQIWSRQTRFQKWLDVELAVCDAQFEVGFVPKKVHQEIMEKASFKIAEIDEEEKVTRHELVAFLNVINNKVGETASRYIHYGMTSSDVIDTAGNLQFKEANVIIEKDINDLLQAIKEIALKYKYTPIVGRSHGVHAEPTTFGLKMAIFYTEIQRALDRFNAARKEVEVGMVSGAVGNYAQIEPQVEELVCKKLGLEQPLVTNQIVQRDRYASYIAVLGILAGSIEKMAVEFRNLARTEIGEIEEPFLVGQKGSSAMPHKKNPVAFEQITGLCRMIRSYTVPAMENIVLWHERDISHSSTERMIFPDITVLVDYVLNKMADLVENMSVNTEKMEENINFTKGLVFSQRLMLRLITSGLSRSDAHTMVQGKIMSALKIGKDFYEHIKKDGEIRRYVTIEEIEALFDLDIYSRQVNYIMKRVFADEEA